MIYIKYTKNQQVSASNPAVFKVMFAKILEIKIHHKITVYLLVVDTIYITCSQS